MFDWHKIDDIFLDLDGTLLDLHFDNYFWKTHLPMCYASHHSMDLAQAKDWLTKELDAHRGKLSWYLTDLWSERLGVDIVALKQEVAHKIGVRYSVIPFLHHLSHLGKRISITTNADHNSLELKFSRTGINKHVSAVYSSEEFGKPKEEEGYWQELIQAMRFDPERTLLIDDNLAVLDSAHKFGIKHLIAINRPDSQQPARMIENYENIEFFDELYQPNRS